MFIPHFLISSARSLQRRASFEVRSVILLPNAQKVTKSYVVTSCTVIRKLRYFLMRFGKDLALAHTLCVLDSVTCFILRKRPIMILRLFESRDWIVDDRFAKVSRKLFQGALFGLRIEEVDHNDGNHSQAHEDEVVSPANVGNGRCSRCNVSLMVLVRNVINFR